MLYLFWFKLLTCNDILLFPTLYHCKLNILGFGLFIGPKQDIWWPHLGVWKNVDLLYSDILYPKQSMNREHNRLMNGWQLLFAALFRVIRLRLSHMNDELTWCNGRKVWPMSRSLISHQKVHYTQLFVISFQSQKCLHFTFQITMNSSLCNPVGDD